MALFIEIIRNKSEKTAPGRLFAFYYDMSVKLCDFTLFCWYCHIVGLFSKIFY